MFLLVGLFGFGQSAEVGVTEGELSVSLSGAATYTIPIAVPPGINGVVPQISLTYNSQGGNGTAGFGWNISGVSAITRIPSTKFHDGVIDPVDYNALDRFALDGQRLIVKNGTTGVYGADKTEYETESFSNIKITSYGVDPLGAKYGPAYFIVEYPDGSKASYGNSPESRSITDWAINYWENPQGVRISYSYSLSYSMTNLISIKYGNIKEAAPINEIIFKYAVRKRPEQFYVGGLNAINNTILKEINVKGNGVGFRNYVLGYDETYKDYQRLISVTEKDENNAKSYNPTIFKYGDLANTDYKNIAPANLDLANIDYQTMDNVSGDFDGDGKTDIILYPKTGTDAKKKYWLYKDISSAALNSGIVENIGRFEKILPTSILEGNSTAGFKLNTKQGWTIIKYDTNSDVATFSAYSSSLASPIALQYEKTYKFLKFTYYSETGYDCGKAQSPKELVDIVPEMHLADIPKMYLSGDFNGDGLTDIIAIETSLPYSYLSGCDADGQPLTVNNTYYGNTYFINMDKRLTENYVFYAGNLYVDAMTKVFIADVNGDGKSDIIVVKKGSVKVYSLDKNNQFETLFTKTDNSIVVDKEILLGDYNGDGKADLLFPNAVGQDSWNFFMSTGTNYNKINGAIGLVYGQSEINKYGESIINNYTSTQSLKENTYAAIDIDGDGKTDVLNQQNYTIETDNGGPSGARPKGTPQMTRFVISYIKAFTGTTVDYRASVPFHFTENKINRFPIPIYASLNDINKSPQYFLITGSSIYGLQMWCNKNDVLLNKVTNGNGVSETISYQPLDTKSREGQYPVYFSNGNVENYPNIDILNDPNFLVVSMLEKKSADSYKKKMYQYYSAVSNVEGLGFLGFRGSMQTNWHDNSSSIISYISKNDMTLRGANIENYSVLGVHEPLFESLTPKIPATIIKENNYTVTGSESLVATQSIKLKPQTKILPGSKFSARINKDATSNSINEPSTFITKSLLAYESDLLPNKVFKAKNISNKQFNGLEDTSAEIKTDYNGYNNPVKITTTVKEGGAIAQTSIVDIEYENSAQPVYVIGRPTRKIQNVTLGGEKMTTEESYRYNSSQLLSEIKKKGDETTDYVTEERYYDGFGNVNKRILKAGQDSRELNYEYDTSGRFLFKNIDAEKLVTTYLYNPNGTLKSQTNPLGQTTTYEYDSWFKKTKEIDYLGNKIDFKYVNSNKNTIATAAYPDGNVTEETFDDLGRKIKSGSKNIMGSYTYVSYEYDIQDRNYKVSEPYIGSSASQWNKTEYDDYGRIKTQTAYTGNITDITYTGLTTKVNDGAITKTYKKDAAGNVVSMFDLPSNEIKYTYFANGNLKESNYDGIKTKIIQDGWGRKIQLDDPSAGIIKYQYNGFGELKSEENKNGITNYNLSPAGRLEGKTISGLYTNSKTTYVYNPNKLLLKTEFEDGANGKITTDYTYDEHKRVNNKTEKTPYAVFAKDFGYDGLGRLNLENVSAQVLESGNSSTKTVKYNYKNGSPYQIKDETDAILWQTNTVNAREQLLTAQNGPITMTNVYNNNGFDIQFKFDKTTPLSNIFSLNAVFDVKTGNLDKRSNSLFGWNENFKHDNLDRLTEYVNVQGNKENQAYDNKGRITQNNLGTYNYSKENPYQNASITVSPEALPYYTAKPSQLINYNVFKSPVLIDEKDVDKVSFDYNDNNSRAAMYYGDLNDEKLKRPFRKYYAGDGSVEIKENKQTGVTDFVTYIGGDGYTAPLVFKSDGIANKKYLYLQRDYQGSIVAITDQTGAVVEKRLFDAWGDIAKVQDGAGNTLAGLTILDRGYTGHEHLQSVGFINMNARLYDPKLHRFLQPDNNIQDPFNTQNYNRYGYVMNNPLKYTDPTGEFWSYIAAALATYIYGGAATGEANPLKWNLNNVMGMMSGVGSAYATGGTNSYIDNYNNKPALGASAIGPGYADMHSFVSNNDNIFGNITHASSENRTTVSSLVTNSTFVGIGYALGKLEDKVEKVGDLRNFKIQDYQPSTKYEFITTKSGITDGKIYMEGTRETTGKLKYLRSGIRYAGYAASTYSLLMSGIDYYDGRIPGSVFLLDIGMTGASFSGGEGTVISAFYFMGVRNTPDYFNHKIIDFQELRKVQIDNTRVRY